MSRLRPYQLEDVQATVEAWKHHDSVLGVAATGLGKAVVIAELVKRAVAEQKRVLVIADMGLLVAQLAKTIEWWTGIKPGIEMNQRRADPWFGQPPPVVCATVQTLYSGQKGQERYRLWRPDTFGLVVADEAEAYIAPVFRAPLDYFKSGGAKLFGCTATPTRTDGKAMGQVFEHVAFNRDIRWGVEQGYLVPPRNVDVSVDLDFSSLKATKNGDYSDAAVARLMQSEQELMSLALGVVRISGDMRTIVIGPKVETAQRIAAYINSHRADTAETIHGGIADESERRRLFDGHKQGAFQYLCSVNMLTKGYDDPHARVVAICRPTRSLRLFVQMMGRGLRLGDPDIGALPDADARRDAIARSDKPYAVIAPMVGVDANVRDLNAVDILGGDMTPFVRDFARRIIKGNPDADILEALKKARDAERRKREQEAQRLRQAARVDGEVHTRWGDALAPTQGVNYRSPRQAAVSQIPSGTLKVLRMAGTPENVLQRMSTDVARTAAQRVMARKARGLVWRWPMAAKLKQYGFDTHELTMTQASQMISRIRSIGWRITNASDRAFVLHGSREVTA